MNKKFPVIVVLFFVVCGVYWTMGKDSQADFELENGYSSLLEGDSLNGWSSVGGEATFEVIDGEIIGRRGPGLNTFLRTDKTYADFTLKMQMRWDVIGNSGVMFRAQQRENDDRVVGYQYELDPSERSWSGGIYDESRRGWIANLENNEPARKAIRLDEWNDIIIEARGASLKTWINGVPAANIIDGLDAEGFIALQVHEGEKGQIRWRHVRIKEHPVLAEPGSILYNGIEWEKDGLSKVRINDGVITGLFYDEEGVEGIGRMTGLRQLDDAVMRLSVPTCDMEGTSMAIRTISNDDGETLSGLQLSVFADRAEAQIVTAEGTANVGSVELDASDSHEVIWVTSGDAATVTVGGKDLVRLMDRGLEAKGQFYIEPARCGDDFTITGFNWVDLNQIEGEPLFYQTLDNEPAKVLSPAEALESFSIAPGFEIELVAAEPLVEDPVAMSWDEFGRLYVVEMRGYMPDAFGNGKDEPVGQIVRLEDTDGDGDMDTSEVFLGGLVNPRAVAVVNGGILIAVPPNLWLCELPTKESLCANKTAVAAYADNFETGNVEHLENRLMQGIDNWLYNSKSARKLKLVDGEMHEQESLVRGQWGMSKDNYGRLFYNHNGTWLQADYFAAEDITLENSTAEFAGLGVNLTNPSEAFSVRVNPGVNRAYLDGTLREDGRLYKATGVSGLAVYRGNQFPAQYQENVFVPEVAANAVARLTLVEEGMTISAEHNLYEDAVWGQREFMASTDERFRPVDAMNGPDGALYVIDMYRGIIQDVHYMSDELREQVLQRQLDKPVGRGRIWRVRHTEGEEAGSTPQLTNATGGQLVSALSHSNGWVRDTAQRLLLAQDGSLQSDLAKVATGTDTIAAIHALWTLEGRNELSRDLVLEIAIKDDPQRQIQALRAGRSLLTSDDLSTLDKNLGMAEEALRMQLTFLQGDYVSDSKIRELLMATLSSNLGSAYIRQAVVRAAHGVELSFLTELLDQNVLASSSVEAASVISVLANNAYRNLRGDLSSSEMANIELIDLLSLATSRSEGNSWQQVAMLEGIASITKTASFVPAELEVMPHAFGLDGNTEEDAIQLSLKAARAAYTWPGDELISAVVPLTEQQKSLMAKGEVFYAHCAICHGPAGVGITGLAPTLVNTD